METLMTYFQPFFGWLLRTTLIASVVICLILLIQKILGDKLGPRWSHALWLVLLIRMILPWAPSSRVSLLNLIPSWDRQIQRAQLSEAAEQQEPSGVGQTSDTAEAISAQKSESDVTIQKRVIPEPGTLADLQIESKLRLVSLRRVLPVLWLAGAIVIGAYLLMSNFSLWRIVKRDRPLVKQAMLELFEECKSQMGVQSLVVVVPSSQIRSPALFGFIRPRLLLPSEMLEKASQEEMRYVFLHELAHLRRYDIYVGWLTSLLQVLHWFNLLIWFAFYRMRADRELACDALVLARTQKEEPQEYGQAIVSLIRRFSRSRRLPAMAGIIENRSQLKRRITMITKFKKNSYQWSPLSILLIIVLACISLPDAQRSRASATAVSKPEATLRRIEVLTHSPRRIHSSPSLDGKYMATTTRQGKLVVSESATGKKWNLTEQGGVAGVGILPLISPDNTKIVYLWSTFKKRTWEVRVVAFDGSDDRLLFSGWIDFDTWSPDGQFLFGRHARQDKDNSTWFMKMSVDDGSMQYIDIVDAKGLSKVDVSSDGRFLAYHRIDKTTSKSDIFIFDLLENRESILVSDPADDKLLGWTPDGQHIFFTSDRMGTSDGWLLAVQQGKSKGLPRMIKPGLGDVVPIRMTRDGSLYYTVQYEAWNVYTVELDLAAGKAKSEPKAVRDMGKDGSPDWSPDGRYLAYCSEPDQSKPQVIRIRTLTTGEERELKPDLPHFEYIRWHPDSRHLLAPYLKSAGLAGVSQIDIHTGQCRDLLTVPVIGSERIREAEMTSDGKTLAYRTRKGKANRLIVKDMDTGREELLLSTEDTVQERFHGGNSWALLPDGKQVALSFLDNGTYQLKTMSVADKTTTTVVPSYSAHLTCINDGRDLLFVRGKDRKELWRVATTGSEPQKVWECEQLIINPRLHPDGRNLAFVSGTFISEMWLMENFLPTTAAGVDEPRTEPAMVLRKVLPEQGDFANVSPDGKYLCDVDWDAGNLYIRELSTGRRWPITDKKSWEDSEEYALDGAISPDGQRVAYLWGDEASDSSNLYVVDLDGSNRKLLCKDTYAMPRDWSADGSKILAIVYGKPHRLVWISASDGSIQQIKDIGREYPGKFDVSPDGRFIAYDLPQAEDAKIRDVFLLDLRDNREISLAQHPANDRLLGWTPDGKSILFASNRSDKWDAWLLGIRDGVPAALPRLVKTNIGDVGAVGFASNGDYYFSNYDLRRNVYIAQFDPARGALLSSPTPLRPAGKSGEPIFSPDGRYLAYSCRGEDEKPLIKIRSLASGQERQFAPKLPKRLHFWAPDGKSLLLSGFLEESWNNAVYTLDLQTGEYSELLRHKDMSIPVAQWFPDGKRLLYHGYHGPIEGTDRLGYLMIRDMDSGAEREIARGVFQRIKDRYWALSPDGRHLAVKFKEDTGRIKIFSTETDEVKEVLAGELAAKVARIIWAPDGKTLMLRVLDRSVSNKSEVWHIAAEGGKSEKLSELDIPEYVTDMRIDPTGRHIALEAITNLHELWVMENFLPEGLGK